MVETVLVLGSGYSHEEKEERRKTMRILDYVRTSSVRIQIQAYVLHSTWRVAVQIKSSCSTARIFQELFSREAKRSLDFALHLA